MKIRSIKLTKEQDKSLKALAEKRGVSGSFLIREALSSYVTSQSEGAASVAALTADLAGCVSGPKDLSTNDEHLADYGRSNIRRR